MAGEFLGASEQLPQDNPYTREFFELLGLKLHVHEMSGMARHLDDGMLKTLGPTERSTSRRNVIVGYPKSNRAPEDQVVPVRHERIVLLPSQAENEAVSRVIVRIPLADMAARTQDDGSFRNAFIEVVSDAATDRFLLNEEGLWRYETAADIHSSDGKEFQVLGMAAVEPVEIMRSVDHYITGFAYKQQTNRDVY